MPDILKRLCEYYLDCLSHDDLGEVSVFANRQGQKYVEVSALPQCNPELNLFDSPAARQLLSETQRSSIIRA